MLMEEDQTNIERRYTFRSEVFSKKIEAHHFSNKLEVTSLCLDFITTKKTALDIPKEKQQVLLQK